jgi:hypothetical protein
MANRTRKRKRVDLTREELLDFHLIRVPETNVAQKKSYHLALAVFFPKDVNSIVIGYMTLLSLRDIHDFLQTHCPTLTKLSWNEVDPLLKWKEPWKEPIDYDQKIQTIWELDSKPMISIIHHFITYLFRETIRAVWEQPEYILYGLWGASHIIPKLQQEIFNALIIIPFIYEEFPISNVLLMMNLMLDDSYLMLDDSKLNHSFATQILELGLRHSKEYMFLSHLSEVYFGLKDMEDEHAICYNKILEIISKYTKTDYIDLPLEVTQLSFWNLKRYQGVKLYANAVSICTNWLHNRK